MSTSAQTSSSIVKLVGDAAIIIPVAGIAIAALTNIFGNFKGKTPHLGFSNTNDIVLPIAKSIDGLISDNLSSNDYAEINSVSFATETINAIRNCNWWKVGNDVELAVSNDPIGGGSLEGTIWKVLLWGMDNSPLGNYSDGYNAITEIFQNTLYSYLDSKGKPELSGATDAIIAQMCSHIPIIYNTNTLSSSTITLVNSLLKIGTTIGLVSGGGITLGHSIEDAASAKKTSNFIMIMIFITIGYFIIKE